MSLRVTSTYKTYLLFSCIFGLAATKDTHTTKAAAAAAEVALAVARAATTPKPWRRSTRITTKTGNASRGRFSSDDSNRTLYFSGPTDALLAPWPALFCVNCSEQASLLRLGSIFVHMPR